MSQLDRERIASLGVRIVQHVREETQHRMTIICAIELGIILLQDINRIADGFQRQPVTPLTELRVGD